MLSDRVVLIYQVIQINSSNMTPKLVVDIFSGV